MDVTTLLLIGVAVLLFSLLLTLLALALYSGLFTSIDVKTGTPPVGSCFIAYKYGTGDYSEVGSYFTEGTNIGPNLKQIGLYYDDPAQVPVEKRRWAIGAILSEDNALADETLKAAFAQQDYKFMKIPAVKTSVNCTFPYTTMVSIFIAVMRVYPALNLYISEHQLEVKVFVEMYFGGDIHFMAPLSDISDFYVPEALQAEMTEEPVVKDGDEPVSKARDEPVTDAGDEPVTKAGNEPGNSPQEESSEDSDGSFEKLDAESTA